MILREEGLRGAEYLIKMRIIGWSAILDVPALPSSREKGLWQKPESHDFLGFAGREVGTAFLSDARAIKGKQLTGQLLASPVCFVA